MIQCLVSWILGFRSIIGISINYRDLNQLLGFRSIIIGISNTETILSNLYLRIGWKTHVRKSAKLHLELVLTILWRLYIATFDKIQSSISQKTLKISFIYIFLQFLNKICYSIAILQAPLFNSCYIYIKEQSYRAFHIFWTCILAGISFFLNLNTSCTLLSKKISFWNLIST